MSKTKKTVVTLIIVAVFIAFVPLFALKGAEFGGSDDAGSGMVEQIAGNYEPCLLYTSPSPRDMRRSRMPSSA